MHSSKPCMFSLIEFFRACFMSFLHQAAMSERGGDVLPRASRVQRDGGDLHMPQYHVPSCPARTLTPVPKIASRPQLEQGWMKGPAASKCGVQSNATVVSCRCVPAGRRTSPGRSTSAPGRSHDRPSAGYEKL